MNKTICVLSGLGHLMVRVQIDCAQIWKQLPVIYNLIKVDSIFSWYLILGAALPSREEREKGGWGWAESAPRRQNPKSNKQNEVKPENHVSWPPGINRFLAIAMIRSQSCLSQEVCDHLLIIWVKYFGDWATCRFLCHCLSGFVCLFVLPMFFLLKVKLLTLAPELTAPV